MESVQTVTSTDVLAGRGNGPNLHPGNIIFRQLVAGKSNAYIEANRGEKKEIIEGVIRQITNNKGRFLGKIDNDGLRHILNYKERLRKTGQAFRDTTDYQTCDSWKASNMIFDWEAPTNTDSCNESCAKKRKKQHSDQSIIPLKYTKLMRERLLSWRSQKNLDKDDASLENVTQEVNGDQTSPRSVAAYETEQNHPFDMPLASFGDKIDFSDNRGVAHSNAIRSVRRRSILACKALPSLSLRDLFSNESEDNDIKSNHGHGSSVKNNIASNQDLQHYPYAAQTDVNETSCSSLSTLRQIKYLIQGEKEGCLVDLNDSVSTFSFEDNLTDNEIDMRTMMAKFGRMSSRDLTGPINLNDSVSTFSFEDNLTDNEIEDRPRENICSDVRAMMAKFRKMSSRDLTGSIYQV